MGFQWYLLIFALAAIVTLIAVRPTIALAKRFDVIDYPDGRRINDTPVPRPGGIALFLGILVSLGAGIALSTLSNDGESSGLLNNINYFGVAAASAVIFCVGLIDDFRGLRVRYKLLGHIVAAVIACFSGVLLDRFTNPFDGSIATIPLFIAVPSTVFYLVAFANIFNLIDGMDGLAAGIAAITSIALFIISFGKGAQDAAFVTMAIAGACLGFLRYNSYPARVFMGDSGALLLGFLLGLVSLFGVVRTPAIISLIVPIVIAGVPVIDTLSAIIRRLRAKKSPVDADTRHIHHRFMQIGYNQSTTVYILYAFSALLATCAILITQYGGWLRLVIFAVLIVLIALIVIRLDLMTPVLTHYYYKRSPGSAEEAVQEQESGEKIGSKRPTNRPKPARPPDESRSAAKGDDKDET